MPTFLKRSSSLSGFAHEHSPSILLAEIMFLECYLVTDLPSEQIGRE
jgi:hypothetical protein